MMAIDSNAWEAASLSVPVVKQRLFDNANLALPQTSSTRLPFLKYDRQLQILAVNKIAMLQ